jgi:hypothetical protein
MTELYRDGILDTTASQGITQYPSDSTKAWILRFVNLAVERT